MPRFLLLISLSAVVLLAACGGGETPVEPTLDTSLTNPTAEQPVQVVEPTLIPPPGQPTQEPPPQATPAPTEPRTIEGIDAPLPIPGTVTMSETQEADAGLTFTKILYYQTGGDDPTPLTVEVYSDGTMTRNGTQSSISQDQVTMLQALIDQSNFFNINGAFTSAGSSQSVRRYRVSIERSDGSSVALTMEESLVPPVVAPLIVALGTLGQ